jgi:hypothetical protein
MHWNVLTNTAVMAHTAIKTIRQFEIMANVRTEPRRRLRKTTMEILTKAMDGAQNF